MESGERSGNYNRLIRRDQSVYVSSRDAISLMYMDQLHTMSGDKHH